jgi:hypothetical protein
MREGSTEAGKDVTNVAWEPSTSPTGGPGEVTIEHRAIDDVIMRQQESAARRLANRLLGKDNRESSHYGTGLHWVKRDR